MTWLLLFKLSAAVTSVVLGAGLLARDHGLKANRLIAALLFCNAWWATQEFYLFQTTDPDLALVYYRLMSAGWIPLGLLLMQASLALSAMENHPLSRLVPAFYVALACVLPLAMTTDFVIAAAERTPLGWRAHFNPGMLLAYALMAVPVLLILGSWREVMTVPEAGGRRRLAQIVFFGVSGAFVSGTLTAVLLPMLRIDSLGLTTTLLSGVGVAGALTLRRFGHALISSQALAREILDTLEDGYVLIDDDGLLRDANRAFLRMVGSSEHSAIGRPMRQWLADLPARGETLPGATLMELATRVGDRMPVVISPPVTCHDGERNVGRAYLLRDRREIVSLQRQLVVSARLAAVGDLAKSISESINAPVVRAREELEGLALDWQTIGDQLVLSDRDKLAREALEEGEELIGESVEGIDRISSIVREVGSFAEEGAREAFARHALDRIVERALRIAKVQAPEGLRVEARLDPDVEISCHFAEIERVVINLVVNAIHALDDRPPDTAQLAIAVMAQDRKAILHVEDNGCGIESDALDRIFDPFFTTKPVGKGTGLGLAISHHIVRSHGGEISVSSVSGHGTSVSVEFPRAPLSSDAIV